MLQGSAAAALFGLPAIPEARAAEPSFKALLDGFADDILRLSPEQATALGVDVGDRATLKSRLADLSPTGTGAWVRQLQTMRAKLGLLDARRLSGVERTQCASLAYAVDRGLEGNAFKFGAGPAAGFFGGATPYVVSQQNGAVTAVPEFLVEQHQIRSSEDAEAYLARVSAFARQLDQESERIRHDAGLGVIPPDFVCTTTLHQLKEFRGVAADRQRLVTSLGVRAGKAGISGDWAKRCAALVASEVYPALDRQIAVFSAAAAKAGPAAGVRGLPDGEAYYQWGLRLGTTTNYRAAEIHQLGLQQNDAIKARIDTVLRSQGLTQGTVGERLQALNRDPRLMYPDTDAGRAELIAYLDQCFARIRPLLPKVSHLGLKAEVVVKRVPPDIQDGAALGYMSPGSLDGARPAIYYVNLKSTSLWAKHQLPTLTAHEGVPGHTWQGAYLTEHHADVPLITSMLGFNAFVEGWALYAEQLMDEEGLYDADPFGRIGYLQAQQFRACRLVADTGLHAMNWSREQSVRFLSAETGKSQSSTTSETDRYCVAPGQACGYKMGHNEILRLRAKAMEALGARFDLAAFDDALVVTGGTPLTVLSSVVDQYIAAAKV